MRSFALGTAILVLTVLSWIPTGSAVAALINWDALTNESGHATVPSGFQGFNFEHWNEFCATGLDECTGDPISVRAGTPGAVFGEYAFSGSGFIMTSSFGPRFSLLSLFATNTWCSPDDPGPGGLICSAGDFTTQGYLGGALLFSDMFRFDPLSQDPVFALLGYTGIDEFRIWNSAAEGLYVDGIRYALATVPEPGTIGLILIGLILLYRTSSLRF